MPLPTGCCSRKERLVRLIASRAQPAGIRSSFSQRTEAREFLDQHGMRPVRLLRENRTAHLRFRHCRVVLCVRADQDPILGGGRIHVILFSFVFYRRKFFCRQLAQVLFLLRGRHGVGLESGLCQQRFFRGWPTRSNGGALARYHHAQQRGREDNVRKRNESSHRRRSFVRLPV
jgi:hypothetical protein